MALTKKQILDKMAQGALLKRLSFKTTTWSLVCSSGYSERVGPATGHKVSLDPSTKISYRTACSTAWCIKEK